MRASLVKDYPILWTMLAGTMAAISVKLALPPSQYFEDSPSLNSNIGSYRKSKKIMQKLSGSSFLKVYKLLAQAQGSE